MGKQGGKGRGRGRGRKQTSGVAPVKPSAVKEPSTQPEPEPPIPLGYNKKLLDEVEQCKQNIIDDPILSDLHTAQPLPQTSDPSVPLKLRSPRQPFDEGQCMAELEAGSTYECGFNLMWISFYGRMVQAAAIAPYKIEKLIAKTFMAVTSDFPWKLVCVLRSGENPGRMRGSIEIATPPELVWAFIMGVSRLLPSISDDDKMLIRRAFLTVPVMFVVIDEVKLRIFRCHKERHLLIQTGETTKRSATQLMMDVLEAKKLLESTNGTTMGAAATASMWRENVGTATFEGADDIKDSYVDAAFTIEKRMLSDPGIKDIIRTADMTMPNNPLDSIYKFEAIIKRAQTEGAIRWCLTGIFDLVKTKTITAGEVALRQLTGRGLPGGKGLLDTLIGKMELGLHLVSMAESMQISSVLVTKLRTWMAGLDIYRKDIICVHA